MNVRMMVYIHPLKLKVSGVYFSFIQSFQGCFLSQRGRWLLHGREVVCMQNAINRLELRQVFLNVILFHIALALFSLILILRVCRIFSFRQTFQTFGEKLSIDGF